MIGKEIGPYKILEQIGQGGMGIVYKGLHLRLEQEVAIKVLASAYARDPAMRQRFIAEAKIQAQLSHPHVVNVLNYLEEGDDVFLVMEYIKGETLEQRLALLGCLAQQEAAVIGRDILAALNFMHSKAIIHRDIKPSNIMFTETGVVKVADFGIAKVSSDSRQTRTGMYLGTLCYMSPEQIQGKPASVASDVYALGVTLYQMVTGRVPFQGDSEYTIMRGQIEQAPVPPWVINAQVSQAFGQIILKALEKRPEHRYRGAQDFAQALTAFRQGPDSSLLPLSVIWGSLGKGRVSWLSMALVAGGGLVLGLFGYFVLFHPLSPLSPTMPISDVLLPSSLVPVIEQALEEPLSPSLSRAGEAIDNPGALQEGTAEPSVVLELPAVSPQLSTPHSLDIQDQQGAQEEASTSVPSAPQQVDVLPPISASREEYRRSVENDPEALARQEEKTTTVPSKLKDRRKPRAPVPKASPSGWRIEKSDGRVVR